MILCEALEARMFFDLVPISITNVPSFVVSTVPTPDNVIVEVQNTGTKSISGAYTLTLLFSTSSSLTLGPLDFQVNTVKNLLTPLAAGATRNLSVNLGTVPKLPADDYYVLAEITGPLTGKGDNIAVSTEQVDVISPFVDLTDTVTLSSDPTTVVPGGSETAVVKVINNGDVAASGPIAISVYACTSSGGADPMLLGTDTENINIAAGQTETFNLTNTVPASTPLGDYYIAAWVNSSDKLKESDYSNNTFVTDDQELDVVSSFPNIVDTFTGTFSVTAGPDFGDTGTITLDVLTENTTTGAVTGTLTTSEGTSSTFYGNVTAGGLLTITVTEFNSPFGSGTISANLSGGVFTGTLNNFFGDTVAFSVSDL
jgi:hypothetical protein